MYDRILVPLDGSKMGEAALPYVEGLVAKLSPGTKVEVTLLRVASSLSHYIVAGGEAVQVPYTEKEIEQLKKNAADYLNKAGEGLRKKGAIVKIVVGAGRAAEEILKATDEIKADLVVMSTHGRSGLSRWAFGSVADRVLRAGKTPLLMVRVSGEAGKA